MTPQLVAYATVMSSDVTVNKDPHANLQFGFILQQRLSEWVCFALSSFVMLTRTLFGVCVRKGRHGGQRHSLTVTGKRKA